MASNGKTPIIVAAVVIAAVAIGTIVMRRSGDAPPLEQAAMQPQNPAPAAAPQAERNATSSPLNPRDSRRGVQEMVARRQEARQELIKKSAEQRKKAAAAFQSEKVDAAWAPKKEGELTSIAEQPAFETAGAVPKDMRIECKSSMCRLDGSFATNGQAEDWVLLYMSSVGSALPNAVVTRTPNPDGTMGVEIYGRAR